MSCFLRCPVFRRLREEAEKRKRPSWNELKGRKGDGDPPGDAKHPATLSRNPAREQAEPGLINPAYEESEDGMLSFRRYAVTFFVLISSVSQLWQITEQMKFGD